nr:hypothetical protein [Tanacetum cinerariifolium]
MPYTISRAICMHDYNMLSPSYEGSSGLRRFFRYAMFIYSFYLCYSLPLHLFTERYAQPYFFSCLIRQIRAEIHKEFRTSFGPSDAGGNPPPVTIHTWLECFKKQKPHSFEKATAPVDADNWISHIENIFDVIDFKKLFFLQFFPRAEQERLKREYHSIRQTNTETSTEFMQLFLRLAGFLGAAAGTEEEQAKNFQLENPIRTLRDCSKPMYEGYMNTIDLLVGNNEVPHRSDTIRTVKLRNDILMFQQHHRESLSEACARFKDLLQKVPHRDLDLWLQVQIFYDHVDCTTQMGIDYAASGRLRKLRPDEAWATIERLAQYEDEGWNDAFIPVEMSLNYENLDIEQLLGIMERKVDTLMKDSISLMGRSEITMSKRQRSTREQSSLAQEEFLVRQNLDQAFFNSISTDPFFGPQWGNLFPVNEPAYQEFVREFFASFEFDASPCRQSRENATLSRLKNGNSVKEIRLLMEFWPTIGDGGFNVGNTKVRSIRDLRVKLAHRCIATTILSKYLKGVRDKNLIYGWMLVTKIARSFRVLTNELRDALKEEEEAEKEAKGDAGHGGVRGSTDIYCNMSQGDWQVRQASSSYLQSKVIFDKKKLEDLRMFSLDDSWRTI